MGNDPREGLRRSLSIPQFPRSSTYDPNWVIENEMGPNALWLTEYLCKVMDLKPGMKVLDLACGKAVSSIFLAREFGVEVWALDLWVSPTDNANRVEAAGLETLISCLQGSALALPFEPDVFDAIICIDAFEYFGLDADFLPSLIQILKPSAQIGIVNAGVLHEIETLPPEWPEDFSSFHTAQWWQELWLESRCVEIEVAEDMKDGRDLWLKWNQILGMADDTYLTSSAGENLSFNRIVGRRTQ